MFPRRKVRSVTFPLRPFRLVRLVYFGKNVYSFPRRAPLFVVPSSKTYTPVQSSAVRSRGYCYGFTVLVRSCAFLRSIVCEGDLINARFMINKRRSRTRAPGGRVLFSSSFLTTVSTRRDDLKQPKFVLHCKQLWVGLNRPIGQRLSSGSL